MDEMELQRAVEQAREARGLPRKPDAPRRLSASLLGAIMAPESADSVARVLPMTQEESDRRQEQDRRRSEWQRSDFPHRHRVKAWVREESGDAWTRARNQVLDAVRGNQMVFLIGDRGTGKTQLAASVACEACMVNGISPRYYRLADLIGRFKRQVFGEGEDEFTFLSRLSRIGLLVLDELQERYDTSTEELILTRLLDHRYGAMKPTILIANLKFDALCEVLRPSVMSRAEECGLLIECNWDNYRRG